MNKKKINITQVCRKALKIMLALPDAAHSVEHVVRVYDWCRRLAVHYPECDLNVLKVAAYWHDVGYTQLTKDKSDHHLKSGEMVEKYLQKEKADKNFSKRVKQAVLEHSFACRPITTEGKILHDADKLSLTEEHAMLDVLDGFKDGYHHQFFNASEVKKATTSWLKKDKKGQSILINGFMLPEAKAVFIKNQKRFLQQVRKIIAMIG